jgi:hypothetical protein
LVERAGKSWREWSTDELYGLLNLFVPEVRAQVAAELGNRFQAGEKEIASHLVTLLSDEDARRRDRACRGLLAYGTDTVLANLSKITKLLDDPKDFIRIMAVKTISKISVKEETHLAMLNATVADPKTAAPNSVRNATQSALFANATKLGE